MAIKIIDEYPDLILTSEELNQLRAAYAKAFQFYAGTPPLFETWARQQMAKKVQLNERQN